MSVYDIHGNAISGGGGSDEPHLSVPWVSSMHRGYSSSTVHENTLEAFYRAYLNGANWIEVDARLSSDGIYISNHDATVTVDGVAYDIGQSTATTLTSLVLSVDPVYGDCHIPTLESATQKYTFTPQQINGKDPVCFWLTFKKDSGGSGQWSTVNDMLPITIEEA